MTDEFDSDFSRSTIQIDHPNSNFSKLEPAALLDSACAKIRESLRKGQHEMADWLGGPLAVSAVPGAGKSTGMAAASAIAIARHRLHNRRQLIVVTFTRSAAANIKSKIRQRLAELSLDRGGFSVHTLHGLALNIAMRHPDLSGLNLENSTLVTPTQSHRLIRTCVELWIAENPRRYQILLEGQQFDGEETERLRRQSVLRTEILPQLAKTVIHEAKSSGLFPEQLLEMGALESGDDYQILAVAGGLYQKYQALLRSREFIDYDEMILAALRVLGNPGARAIEQKQVFAVFEDEAQDSTPLQTELLEILATDPDNPNSPPNFIRVGDPNQAINSTFTPADPIYFNNFCDGCELENKLATMDGAGRSSQVIIDAANFMLNWVNDSEFAKNEKPFRDQTIKPVNSDDPQKNANPAPIGLGLELHYPRDIYQTVELIGKRVIELVEEFLPADFVGRSSEKKIETGGEASEEKNPLQLPLEKLKSMAILVRENKQGKFIKEVLENPKKHGLSFDLQKYGIKIEDVGERDRHSQVPWEILTLLQFLDRPHSPDYLKAALKILSDRQLIPKQDYNAFATSPEQFLYPGPLDPQQSDPVRKCRYFCSSLLQARLELPPYQIISFLALALQYDQTELATADKLAERVAIQTAGNNSMQNILEVLGEIVSSERFEPVDADDKIEERYTSKGQLTIITMHKAKGLDWDCVFLPFLHEQTIPGNLRVLPQTRFLGDFTLAEVARAQIRASLHKKYPLPNLAEAWEQADYLKKAEEFRLLYVAMTRAKSLLWMAAEKKGPFSWNKPDNLQEQKPCPVMPVLKQRFPGNVML
ncbi:ATP-dependent helicase [Tychonema sp. LEGE 07203]|uniref:ATP-dependent helicase n=1 Tax=Tychonema sp. LEGE 07203 TaxID=1828671 RepID=UPI00187F166E|nr:ATP-dependent helicase [Tychonema sp. LEGE 07203]MBE9094916.1 ATP-dependent helicase [Tychonema sp. LEGE 07203]